MISSIEQSKRYYPFLDGFRAWAILWVVFHNSIFFFHFDKITGIYFKPLFRIGFLGFLGVDLFFVISGFLITGLLVNDLQGQIHIKRFYLRRFFKIVPHYFFIVMIGFAALTIVSPQEAASFKTIFNYFIFLQNYLKYFSILRHLWSIAVEEHFYLIYPIILWGVTCMHPGLKQRRRILFGVLVALLLLGNALRYHAWIGAVFNGSTLTQMSHVRFDALIFGCLIKLSEPYILSIRSAEKKKLSLFSFWSAVMLFSSFYFKFNMVGWGYYTAAYIASGLLIISALLAYAPLLWITEAPFLIWIGKNSYGIYLWHYIILLFLFSKDGIATNYFSETKLFPGQSGIILGITFYIVLSILFGALTTQTIEKFFLNIRKNIAP